MTARKTPVFLETEETNRRRLIFLLAIALLLLLAVGSGRNPLALNLVEQLLNMRIADSKSHEFLKFLFCFALVAQRKVAL